MFDVAALGKRRGVSHIACLVVMLVVRIQLKLVQYNQPTMGSILTKS